MGRYLDEIAGPKGFVQEFKCSFRGMDEPGNDLIIKGSVTGKRQEGGKNLVDIEVWTENPDGQKTSPGSATVELPSKG